MPINRIIEEVKTRLVNLIGQAVELLPAIILAFVILLVTAYCAKLTKKLVAKAGDRTIGNPSLRSVLVQVSYVTAWVVGILIACTFAFPGLGLGDIIGLLGLSSVAVGFAFQDIFKNFLAGILLLLQEPFQINDEIEVEGYTGVVEEIAIRSTQIRTYQGEKVVIPNSIVFTSPVTVLTAYARSRTDLGIGVDYNTPLPMAQETLLAAVKSVDGVLAKPEPEVDVVSFGDSAIDLVVRYWTFPERPNSRRVQTKVVVALKQECDRVDINIPYPIRTVYYFDQDKYNDHYAKDGATTNN